MYSRRSIVSGGALGLLATASARSCPAIAAPAAPGDAINVREFGAKGDGKADDTSAFHRAFRLLNEGRSKRLRIPFGTYVLRETLKIDQPFCIVEGDNPVLKFVAGNYAPVDLGGGNVVRPLIHVNGRACSLSALQITGRSTNSDCGLLGYASDVARNPQGSWGRIVLDQIDIRDVPGDGLRLVRAEQARILQTWAQSCGRNGIVLDDCAYSYLENVRSMHSGATGVHIDGCLHTVGVNLESLRSGGLQLAILNCLNTRFVEPDLEIADSWHGEPRGVLIAGSRSTTLIGGNYSHLGTVLFLEASVSTTVSNPVVYQTAIRSAFVEARRAGASVPDPGIGPMLKAFLDLSALFYKAASPPLVVTDPASEHSLSVKIDPIYMRGFSKKVTVI